jgi:hypothetical protein
MKKIKNLGILLHVAEPLKPISKRMMISKEESYKSIEILQSPWQFHIYLPIVRIS